MKKFQQKLPKDLFDKANLTASLNGNYTFVETPAGVTELGKSYKEAVTAMKGEVATAVKPEHKMAETHDPVIFTINSATQGMRLNRT
jgi:hypothetical protein